MTSGAVPLAVPLAAAFLASYAGYTIAPAPAPSHRLTKSGNDPRNAHDLAESDGFSEPDQARSAQGRRQRAVARTEPVLEEPVESDTAPQHRGAPPAGSMTDNQRYRTPNLPDVARASNTRSTYAGALRRLDRWLAGRPLDDAALAAFLDTLSARGRSLAAGRIAVAAVRLRALATGAPNPAGAAAEAALRRLADAAGPGRGQAAPMSPADLAAIARTAHLPRPAGRGRESPARARRRGRVDLALAGLMFHGGFRRSEVALVCAADVARVTTPAGAVRVRLTKSKTNQAGRRADVRLIRGPAARALLDLAAQAAPEQRLIPLSGRQVARRIDAAARAAGITDRRLTGHSGRVGLAVELTRAGAPLQAVMLAGGWKSAEMVKHYAAPIEAEHGAVARYLEDGPEIDVEAGAAAEPAPRPGRILRFTPGTRHKAPDGTAPR